MVLKDWKKTGKDEWYNDKKMLLVTVEKQIYKWEVEVIKTITDEVNYTDILLERKFFKTKSEALKYARDYMRKN